MKALMRPGGGEATPSEGDQVTLILYVMQNCIYIFSSFNLNKLMS